MKNLILSLMIILCFCSVVTNAQDNNSNPKVESEFEKECGPPGLESGFLLVVEGKVNSINNDNSLGVIVRDEQRTVRLVAVSPKTNAKAVKKHLTERLLNKKIELYINPSDEDESQFFATIIKNSININRYLLENGITEYKAIGGYALLGYASCVYQQVEQNAKNQHLGIWSK